VAQRTIVKAVAYIRVSTTDQETAQQRREILRAAKSRGVVIDRWYEERITGRTLKRPALQQLREDSRERKFGILFVWALDRLSRAGILDSLSLVKELDARAVQVISLKDILPDPGEPHRDLVLSVLFWVAEQESRRKSERVKAALDRIRAEGGRLGRRPVDVDMERVTGFRKIGRSWRSIARTMKVSKATLLRHWRSENPSTRSRPKRP
jgi:DNA invertase Pin-like site-specific DNA recombinase